MVVVVVAMVSIDGSNPIRAMPHTSLLLILLEPSLDLLLKRLESSRLSLALQQPGWLGMAYSRARSLAVAWAPDDGFGCL